MGRKICPCFPPTHFILVLIPLIYMYMCKGLCGARISRGPAFAPHCTSLRSGNPEIRMSPLGVWTEESTNGRIEESCACSRGREYVTVVGRPRQRNLNPGFGEGGGGMEGLWGRDWKMLGTERIPGEGEGEVKRERLGPEG